MTYKGYTRAQGEATMRYQANLKSYNLRMQPDLFEHYKTSAESLGVSVRQLFLLGADQYIENHINKN